MVLIWKTPGDDTVQVAAAAGSDLLALKIVCEALDHRETAAAGGVSLGHIENILYAERRQPFFGGCTGFGCGAAFNFVSLLPDGEVHACRKFPSPIDRLGRQSLTEIYESEAAARYRQGSSACTDCRLRPVCRGCMAVVHGLGLDPFTALDPYCFFRLPMSVN